MKKMILKMMLFLLFLAGMNLEMMAQDEMEARIKVNIVTLPSYTTTTGAIVKLYQNVANEWVLVQQLTTNGSLSYVFMYLLDGVKYKVEVSLEGYLTQSNEIEALHGEVVFYFALSPERTSINIFNGKMELLELRYIKRED
jgi:hypothetical protein